MDREKVVIRYLDGRIIKGEILNFSPSDGKLIIEDLSSESRSIDVEELKAIFFVRSFEGDRNRVESKSFLGTIPSGKRVFVRFKDGEAMTGYVEGEIPWKKGFFLESSKGIGFFLIPVDSHSNNIKVFVVSSAVRDVTVMG
jgi:small nuclear ribonucleoprotein (snRNP)-like protein